MGQQHGLRAVGLKTPQRSSGLQREGKVLGKHGLLWLVCPRLLWTCCTQVLYLLLVSVQKVNWMTPALNWHE